MERFSGTIALTCSVTGPAPIPTCGVSPASVKPTDSATLTVTAAALAAGIVPLLPIDRTAGLCATLLPLGMFGCVLATSYRKQRRRFWILYLFLLMAAILPVACGGGSSSGPPPVQHYTVTVAATSGSIQHHNYTGTVN